MKCLNLLLLFAFLLLTTQCSDDSGLVSLEADIQEEQSEFVTHTLKSKSYKDKNDKWQEDFATIQDEILARNKNRKFLTRLIRSVGSPDWDNAFSASESGEGFPYFIPFYTPDDTNTGAVLMVTQHKNDEKLNFNLVEREPFIALLEKIPLKKAKVDHLIFTTLFQFFDIALFEHDDMFWADWILEYDKHKSTKDMSHAKCESSTICITTYIAYALREDESRLKDYVTKCYTIINCTGGSGGAIGGAIGGGSYGGSYGGGSSCYSCGTGQEDPVEDGGSTSSDSDPSAAYANLNDSEYNHLLVEGLNEDEIKTINRMLERVNECEKELIIAHPLCALRIRTNRDIATAKTIATFGYNGRNDCSDAFRHAFFNGLNAQYCGISLAREFGEAHECEFSSTYPPTQMDLYNNEVGYTYAGAATSDEHLATLICRELEGGRMKIIEDDRAQWSYGCTCN